MVNDCVIIPDLTWRILNPINNQFETIYVICDTYKEKRIKNTKRRLCGSTQQQMLKRLNILQTWQVFLNMATIKRIVLSYRNSIHSR